MGAMNSQTLRLLGNVIGQDAANDIASLFANVLVSSAAAATAYQLARIANQTSESFPAVSDRWGALHDTDPAYLAATGPPVGDAGTATCNAFIDLSGGGSFAQRGAKIVPFGKGADNSTFSIRIFGWTQIGNANTTTTKWHATLLAEVQCTLTDSLPGLTDTLPVDSSSYYAGDIVLIGTSGNIGVSCEIVAPQNDTPAHLVVDLKGSQVLELQFSREGNGAEVATECNALVSLA